MAPTTMPMARPRKICWVRVRPRRRTGTGLAAGIGGFELTSAQASEPGSAYAEFARSAPVDRAPRPAIWRSVRSGTSTGSATRRRVPLRRRGAPPIPATIPCRVWRSARRSAAPCPSRCLDDLVEERRSRRRRKLVHGIRQKNWGIWRFGNLEIPDDVAGSRAAAHARAGCRSNWLRRPPRRCDRYPGSRARSRMRAPTPRRRRPCRSRDRDGIQRLHVRAERAHHGVHRQEVERPVKQREGSPLAGPFQRGAPCEFFTALDVAGRQRA